MSRPSSLGTAKPLLAEDIGVTATPHAPYESALRSLCRPSFSGTHPGLFLSGTEDQGAPAANRLLLGKIDFAAKRTRVTEAGTPAVWTHPTSAPVGDVHWASACHAVAALGSRLALVRVHGPDSDTPAMEVALLPPQHTDVVRELAPNPLTPHTIASGGCDGNVIITDFTKVSPHCHVSVNSAGSSAAADLVSWALLYLRVVACVCSPGGCECVRHGPPALRRVCVWRGCQQRELAAGGRVPSRRQHGWRQTHHF